MTKQDLNPGSLAPELVSLTMTSQLMSSIGPMEYLSENWSLTLEGSKLAGEMRGIPEYLQQGSMS